MYFVITDISIQMPNYQYVVCDTDLCLLRFTELNMNGLSILGEIFLQGYYVVFDQENRKIGFAEKNFKNVEANLD